MVLSIIFEVTGDIGMAIHLCQALAILLAGWGVEGLEDNGLYKGIGGEEIPVDGVNHKGGVFSGYDEVSLLQPGEVTGDVGLGRLNNGFYLAHAEFALIEKTQDTKPRLISHGFEDGEKCFFHDASLIGTDNAPVFKHVWTELPGSDHRRRCTMYYIWGMFFCQFFA